MKKSVILLVIMAFFAYTAGNVNAKGDDTKLVKDCHPRLVLDKDEFRQLKKLVGGDDALGKLHNHLINVADASVANSERFESVIDAKGKYVARRALARLVSCAYAHKMTGGRQYRDKAIQDLTDVCSFEDWGPKSFLDVSEMATAVSIAYDWLYESLPKNLRAMIVTALKENALEASRGNNKYTWWYKRIGNWNQVCNSGLVCAAVAVYEHCPQLAQEVIDDAIRTNKVAVEGIYGPDGAYPEGPTYWGYGTIYEVLMLTVMDDIFGTDYGLSSSPGFLNTGDFLIFTRGPKNMSFNFADNGPRTNYAYPLYYFAYKRNEPSMLYGELPLINERSYTSSAHKALMILPIKYAMKMNLDGLTGPSRKFYSAQGNVPLMICRSGWNADDHYLGIKGGKGAELHGHMDAGMFVYYADGVRWAMDLGCESYNNIRPAFSRAGRKLFDMSQNSLRWRLFRMHSRQHNTLTVNDKDHNVAQKVEMTATENTASRMAATFNLTPLFDGDLEKAERTAALCDEKYLEVRDVLKAPADRPAHVRWTMLSEAKPEITLDGIVLTCRTLSRKLKTHGGNVTYRIWSSDINDYDNIFRENGKPVEIPIDPENPVYIIGYEIDIPAGEELTLTTILE